MFVIFQIEFHLISRVWSIKKDYLTIIVRIVLYRGRLKEMILLFANEY
jgi:hypothetical protein